MLTVVVMIVMIMLTPWKSLLCRTGSLLMVMMAMTRT